MEYKPWKDLTDEEKGALLLAQHEGKLVEGKHIRMVDWHSDKNKKMGVVR